jgi:hypothetical protein
MRTGGGDLGALSSSAVGSADSSGERSISGSDPAPLSVAATAAVSPLRTARIATT